MRQAYALLPGLIMALLADGAMAARLGYVHASCLSQTIAPHDAISACTAVLQKFHTQTDVFIRRAAAFMEIGAFDYAVGDLSRAIRLDPGGALAYELRGLAYELQGRPAESLEDYRTARALGRADAGLESAILRVTAALEPPPVVAASLDAEATPLPPAASPALSVAPEAPARAADGWLIAVCLLLTSAALAARPSRRRGDAVAT